MKLLHTKLPEFIKKMQVAAAEKGNVPKEIDELPKPEEIKKLHHQ